MRRLVPLFAMLFATSACGGGNEDRRSSEDLRTMSAEESSVSTEAAAPSAPPPPPGIAASSAPGVAFNYSYAFRLEAERIAPVQERHAAMCEALGPNRCRITGMLYRVRNESDIEARLDFKLDPSIARRFGREGVNVVNQAEGMLVESQITGTDVGTSIRQVGRSIAQMEEDLRRIEGRLAGRLSAGERQSLENEAQMLRQSIRAAQQNREDAQESLANTPMSFVYGSGDLVPGADARRPVRDALRNAGSNFVDGVAMLFVIIVSLLPWLIVGGLVWMGVRAVRRRRPKAPAPALAAPAAPDTGPDA